MEYFWKDTKESVVASGKGGVWGSWSEYFFTINSFISLYVKKKKKPSSYIRFLIKKQTYGQAPRGINKNGICENNLKQGKSR